MAGLWIEARVKNIRFGCKRILVLHKELFV